MQGSTDGFWGWRVQCSEIAASPFLEVSWGRRLGPEGFGYPVKSLRFILLLSLNPFRALLLICLNRLQ